MNSSRKRPSRSSTKLLPETFIRKNCRYVPVFAVQLQKRWRENGKSCTALCGI